MHCSMAERFTVIILAAQREGMLDPLAAEAGVSHKCLVPIGGRPLLAHVLDAIAAVDGVSRVRISVEPGAAERLRAVANAGAPLGIPIEFVAAEATITDSVYAAAEGAAEPYVITTADNVLLTPAAVHEVVDRLRAGDDTVIALSRREDVLSAHPEGQRRFYRFTDDSFSNCNLYGLSAHGLALAEIFRSGGQFAKNPKRIAMAFGIFNLILLRYGLISLDSAVRRLSRRFKARVSTVVLADGAHAIDVDNARTYSIAAELLERRTA